MFVYPCFVWCLSVSYHRFSCEFIGNVHVLVEGDVIVEGEVVTLHPCTAYHRSTIINDCVGCAVAIAAASVHTCQFQHLNASVPLHSIILPTALSHTSLYPHIHSQKLGDPSATVP